MGRKRFEPRENSYRELIYSIELTTLQLAYNNFLPTSTGFGSQQVCQ